MLSWLHSGTCCWGLWVETVAHIRVLVLHLNVAWITDVEMLNRRRMRNMSMLRTPREMG